MFNSIKNLFATSSRKSIQVKSRPAIEALETRTVMSGTSVSLSSAHILNIVGTNNAEQVTVSLSGSKVKVSVTDFDSNGHTHSFTKKFSASKVEQIVYT